MTIMQLATVSIDGPIALRPYLSISLPVLNISNIQYNTKFDYLYLIVTILAKFTLNINVQYQFL